MPAASQCTNFVSSYFMQHNSIKLSPRENEILELIYIGNTDLKIAETLSISSNTVRTHRQNLRAKFNASNTVEMLSKAVKLKIIIVKLGK